MKFKSEKDMFVEALSAAGRVASRSPGATSGILLTLTGNALTITGTDLDLTTRVNLDVIGFEDGAVVVPARLIVESTRRLDAGAVTVETKDDNVLIELGRAKYSLRTFSVVDYPKLPAVPAATTTLGALDIVAGLGQVARASSNDEARPLLTGVLFTHDSGNLRLVATDSYRLAIRDVAGVPALGERDLIVPTKAVVELQRAAANLPLDSQIGVVQSEAEIHFIVGQQSISSRLIDGSYPDYRQLIPQSYPNSLRIGKDTFLSSLGRIRVLASDTSSSVRLSLNTTGIDVATTSADQGNVSDRVDSDYRGEEMTIAFNPRFLMEGIEATPGDEVILETTDPTRPAMVHGVEDTSFRYLLMPVRVQ